MAKMDAPASPDAFVAALSGWQTGLVVRLRMAILAAADFQETIKWGNLVYLANGPCVLIRAEEHRVLLGFWRGKRLTGIEPRIVPSGKYELGNITLCEGNGIESATIVRLAREAGALNRQLGDPTSLG